METDLMTTEQENTNNEEIPETTPGTVPEETPEETPADVPVISDTEDIQQGEDSSVSDTEDLQENPESDTDESLEDGEQLEILDGDTVSGSNVRTDEDFVSALSDAQRDYTDILQSIDSRLETLETASEMQTTPFFEKAFDDYTPSEGLLLLFVIAFAVVALMVIFSGKR